MSTVYAHVHRRTCSDFVRYPCDSDEDCDTGDDMSTGKCSNSPKFSEWSQMSIELIHGCSVANRCWIEMFTLSDKIHCITASLFDVYGVEFAGLKFSRSRGTSIAKRSTFMNQKISERNSRAYFETPISRKKDTSRNPMCEITNNLLSECDLVIAKEGAHVHCTIFFCSSARRTKGR